MLPPGLEPGMTVPKTVVISVSLQELSEAVSTSAVLFDTRRTRLLYSREETKRGIQEHACILRHC